MKTIQQLCVEYGCDKTPEIGHSYAPKYDELFRGLSPDKILEIGVGYPELMDEYTQGHNYQTGASLKVWRNYFPATYIYGIDIHPDAIFTEDRISTLLGNSTDSVWVAKVMTPLAPFDIIIDDGSHDHKAQQETAKNFLPLVRPGGMYFIEDASWPDHFMRDFYSFRPQKLTSGRGDTLILIRP